MISTRCALIAIAVCFGFVVIASAVMPAFASHPFHVCVGQMTWNAESNRWEVSIRLHPQDLERALSAELGRAVSNEDVDFDKTATDYLNRHFFLRSFESSLTRVQVKSQVESEAQAAKQHDAVDAKSADQQSKTTWVGMESERGWLWLHVEMTSPSLESKERRLWMVNRLLLDHVERQENSVLIETNPKSRYSLQFKKDDWLQAMK